MVKLFLRYRSPCFRVLFSNGNKFCSNEYPHHITQPEDTLESTICHSRTFVKTDITVKQSVIKSVSKTSVSKTWLEQHFMERLQMTRTTLISQSSMKNDENIQVFTLEVRQSNCEEEKLHTQSLKYVRTSCPHARTRDCRWLWCDCSM